MAEIFRRVEEKYIINAFQYKKLIPELKKYMNEDEHGKSTICNVYFDTKEYDLIRHSITKPYYKEKIRLRSYNTPSLESKVYLEIKRKCDKVVSKRRIEMKLEEFNDYIKTLNSHNTTNKQIQRELDYTFKFYNLKPTMYLSYEREAYYQKDNMDFRATFDTNVIARNYDLNLEKGSYGKYLLNPNFYILEIKTLGSIPLWFVKLINEIGIKQGNFSKYGEAYEQIIMNKDISKVTGYVFQNSSITVKNNSMAYAI